jgi:isochorismate hydrolase
MSGPMDMQTLISHAEQEGQLQAPKWAANADILNVYTSQYGVPISYKAEAEYSSAQKRLVMQMLAEEYPIAQMNEVLDMALNTYYHHPAQTGEQEMGHAIETVATD